MKALFKAKRADNGEWVIGDLIHLDIRTMIAGLEMQAYDKGNTHDFIELECVEVIPKTVCLYSEFPDKNGNKISVGDIITSKDNPYKYYVVFENGSFVCYHMDKALGKWGLLSRFFDADVKEAIGEIEIIGNIHDDEK